MLEKALKQPAPKSFKVPPANYEIEECEQWLKEHAGSPNEPLVRERLRILTTKTQAHVRIN